MARPDQISLTDLDASSAILISTDERPTLKPGRDLVEFIFSSTPEVQQALSAYTTGQLSGPLKKFATCRNLLFRAVKDCLRSGTEVKL